jgi:NAD+ synthase (glutamine-hydrolysing)
VDDEPGQRVDVPFVFPELDPGGPHEEPDPWEAGSHVKEEELTRAVALGLFDYLRKSRARGYVVSLSGGADSSAVACLVALMVRLGVAELGLDGFAVRVGRPGLARDADGPETMVRALLTTVYQATANSSGTTRDAARGVADALGAEHHELDVEPLVQTYVTVVGQAIGRELEWARDDLALQNIQARVRSPAAWLLANLRGAILLATSNRSEAAVGYATMDGDTSGGLSPIAGIDKAFLRSWLRWLETVGPDGGSPVAALAAVNAQQPTAELRPPGEGQTDEGDLMPYDVLDAIERAAVRDKHEPREVLRLLQVMFPEHPRGRLADWVARFFRLFARNQWKRERYAPGFHLDDANLDPRSWYRFPILSGGFERELAELQDFVEPEI